MVSQDLNRNFANFTFNIQGAIMLCHNLFFLFFFFCSAAPVLCNKSTTPGGHRFHWLISSEDASLKPPKILIHKDLYDVWPLWPCLKLTIGYSLDWGHISIQTRKQTLIQHSWWFWRGSRSCWLPTSRREQDWTTVFYFSQIQMYGASSKFFLSIRLSNQVSVIWAVKSREPSWLCGRSDFPQNHWVIFCYHLYAVVCLFL